MSSGHPSTMVFRLKSHKESYSAIWPCQHIYEYFYNQTKQFTFVARMLTVLPVSVYHLSSALDHAAESCRFCTYSVDDPYTVFRETIMVPKLALLVPRILKKL